MRSYSGVTTMQYLPLSFAAPLALLLPITRVLGNEGPAAQNEFFIYIGTYTGQKSKGIYIFHQYCPTKVEPFVLTI